MKIILSLFLYAIIFSCSSPAKHEENNQDLCTEYACPAHQDKTSTKPGTCPVCNIKLIPVNNTQTKNDIKMKNQETFETGCCPRFNVEPWQEKEITFQNKLFLKDHVTSFFHIPLNFGKVMSRDMAKIEKNNAAASKQLVLTDEKSLWGSDIYIETSKEIPGETMEKISGNFLAKVFEGPYGNMSKHLKEMDRFVESRGKKNKKTYFYYPYCPKCAKEYGKNYTVILVQI